MFKNVKKEEITIPAQMSYLVQIRDFVEHIGKKYRYDEKLVNSFKLVIDEACTNVIRHGYRDIKNGEITVKAIARRLSLTIVIIDQGRTYDPRQANTPDLAKYVDIGKKGGLGIMMMRKLMDDLQYAVTERGNEFRLTKKQEPPEESKFISKWRAFSLRAKYSLVASLILTVITVFIFSIFIFDVRNDVNEEVFAQAASNCRSLADNAMDDLLNENTLGLFEKARSVKNNNQKTIQEAFVVLPDGRIEARSTPLKMDGPGNYSIPENAIQLDSLANVKVMSYSLGDSSYIYDLSTTIRQSLLGEGTSLGEVHIWVDERSLIDIASAKRLRLILYLLIIIAIGYVGSFFLIHRILTPFQNLAEWVRQVVHDKVDQDEIDIDTSDELGEIAQAINDMNFKFREAQVNLMEQQKLQKELQVAQEIQQMLLPSDFPEVEGFEISSYYEAAKEVGGDLFDFVEVDEDTIGIIVADVSGKGVPGSLIMTMIRTALRLESRGNKNPADVLAKVNRFVTDDMKRGMFVTMFYIILDSRNRIIHYASAGHNPMILYRGSAKKTYYLNPSGFPVGIQLPDITLFDRKIETDSIRLREDDILILYTDGITEAMNSKRELYREERFLDAIRNNGHLDVAEFVRSVKGDLKTFTGGAPQNDDITFVSVKEKLMPGEVVYKIHKELLELISSGSRVKDACDQMRVSQYHYYKYKSIVEEGGLDALREYLEGQDYVEKKHLSVELKAKIFDIIRKHPEYGANRIVNDLNTELYGFEKLDSQRLYNEMVKLKLNTKEQRVRFVSKGDKRALKQPGTPLLTLDGKVIMNFQSSESEIAKRTGEATQKLTSLPIDTKKAVVREFNTDKTQKPEKKDESVSPLFMHQSAKSTEPAKPEEPAKEPDKEKPLEKAPPAENSTTEKENESAEVSVEGIENRETITVNQDGISFKPTEEAEKPGKDRSDSVKNKTDQKEKLARKKTREELLATVVIETDSVELAHFFDSIADDLAGISSLLRGIDASADGAQEMKKINLILKIMLKNPILKKLPDIQRIYEQTQESVALLESKFKDLGKEFAYSKLKDLLKYVEKDYILNVQSSLTEINNKIGIIRRHITAKLSAAKTKNSSEMDIARKKLAQKKIVSNTSLLESLVKNDKN
ncbi:MAG: SpoIIE family protein phosphatase [Calditrichaceae bacterium]